MVWDAKTFEVMAAIDPSPVFGIAVTPDSKHLLTCDAKGNVKTHELPKR
jgi:hypothetical protein